MIREPDEKIAPANGIQIAYEEIGDAVGVPLLLIMGLGSQMIHWPDGFCDGLAQRGFRVIRFDNRDSGHSTKLDDAIRPTIEQMLARSETPAYLLTDLADDALGLLDHLGLDAAHIVGISMGGMVAQLLAIEHPERVLSLTSIMSTTGDTSVGRPTEAGMMALATPAPNDRELYPEHLVKMRTAIGSPGFPVNPEFLHALAIASFDRCFYPPGVARQLHASIGSPDRTEELGAVRVPTAVIHGREDPLITLSGGEATAAAIPGATLKVIDGMGHDLPPGVWPVLIDEIARVTGNE